jgi:hypothetical protein
VSSSGPDDDGAWLQVGAGALKHSVASGCIPEATLHHGLMDDASKYLDLVCDTHNLGPTTNCKVNDDL